jgi:hypothetical protein
MWKARHRNSNAVMGDGIGREVDVCGAGVGKAVAAKSPAAILVVWEGLCTSVGRGASLRPTSVEEGASLASSEGDRCGSAPTETTYPSGTGVKGGVKGRKLK